MTEAKVPCPVCKSDHCPVAGNVDVFQNEFGYHLSMADIPEKYAWVRLAQLKASEMSRLPILQQTALYDELRAKPTSGWAFFSPAGYSKTTCSIALYRRAIVENLHRSWELYSDRSWLAAQKLHVWRKSVPDLFAQIFARYDDKTAPQPDITVEKIQAAKNEGFTPRVFLEEIDKQKITEHTAHQMFRLVDALDRHVCQIVLDSNLSTQQFLDMYGEPIARRIKENCIIKEYGFEGGIQ
jgi:hypothetical protein